MNNLQSLTFPTIRRYLTRFPTTPSELGEPDTVRLLYVSVMRGRVLCGGWGRPAEGSSSSPIVSQRTAHNKQGGSPEITQIVFHLTSGRKPLGILRPSFPHHRLNPADYFVVTSPLKQAPLFPLLLSLLGIFVPVTSEFIASKFDSFQCIQRPSVTSERRIPFTIH